MAQMKRMTKKQFKAWRKRMGLSQPQAAARLGVAVGTLRNWEYAKRNIPMPVARLCEMIEQHGAAA